MSAVPAHQKVARNADELEESKVMILGPHQRKFYSCRDDRTHDNEDVVIKIMVVLLGSIGFVCVIAATIFGHNWTP